ncbi:hypothetical protein BVRB_6g138700 [Beta vulgaris subsp. vulgaris]|nr:hypothetical protein BVRB_6g138700 [Beta vulgaris subsp. vulgaris]
MKKNGGSVGDRIQRRRDERGTNEVREKERIGEDDE